MEKHKCFTKPNILLIEIQGYYDGASIVQCTVCGAMKCRFTNEPVTSINDCVRRKLGRPGSFKTKEVV